MRSKIAKSIIKIMNVDMNTHQAGMHFNVRMTKSVFFRCSATELNARQENELRRIYKEPMLVKLGLSKNYPRIALCLRKSALGVRLMLSNTLIAALKLKACIRNKKEIRKCSRIIKNTRRMSRNRSQKKHFIRRRSKVNVLEKRVDR